MAKPGFYNDNRNRAYPFVKGTVGRRGTPPTVVEGLPDAAVVDAGFLMGLASGFEDGVHSVWLDSVVRVGTLVTLTFRSDAPGLYERPLAFAFDAADPQYGTLHVENLDDASGASEASDGLYSESAACPPEPLWSGFVVAGRLDGVPSGTATRSDGGGVVEPALVQNVAGSYVGSVNLANADRTRVDAPDGCPPLDNASPAGTIFVNAKCMRGDVRFKPGYNAVVRQSNGDNLLTLSADVGAGEGQPCEEVPLFAGEASPDGGSLLSGGVRCNEVIRTINGVGGRYATLLAGTGVEMTQLPDRHTIVLDVNMNQLALCFGDSLASEVSESL